MTTTSDLIAQLESAADKHAEDRDTARMLCAAAERLAALGTDAGRYVGLRAKHAQELCDFIYGQTVPCDLPADWGRELDEWVDAENSVALSAQERGNV